LKRKIDKKGSSARVLGGSSSSNPLKKRTKRKRRPGHDFGNMSGGGSMFQQDEYTTCRSLVRGKRAKKVRQRGGPLRRMHRGVEIKKRHELLNGKQGCATRPPKLKQDVQQVGQKTNKDK